MLCLLVATILEKLEIMEKEKIEQLTQTIRELTSALNSIKGSSFHFDEVSPESILNPKIDFKKYLLKNTFSDYISTEELREGRELRRILDTLIETSFANEFINVNFIDKSSRVRYSDEGIEQFSIIFRKTYDRISGSIRVFRVDEQPEKIKLGDISSTNDKAEINVDFVRTACLKYVGPEFTNKNVLLFGPNVEENPYLVELLNCFPPKNLINIVPLGSARSFFDNVD